MKTNIKKEKVIATGMTMLFFLSLIGTGIYYQSNQSLKQGLNASKLKSETLLSEKLLLDKEIRKFRNEIASLKGKNSSLDRLLAETGNKLTAKEAEIKTIVRENSMVKSLKKQLAEVQGMKNNLESQIAELNLNFSQLKGKNDELSKTIAALEDENKALADNVKLLSSMAADHFRIESLKGEKKEKLTVNARRTRKLTVSFEIPENVISDVNFRIKTPQGKKISSKNNEEITSTVLEDSRDLTASISPVTGEFEVSKRVEMAYKPKEKLSGGIYHVEIYNGDTYLGSCQVKLK